MAKGPLASVRNLFSRLFPERQLYHRSHGQVRFVSMSAQTQIALLVVTLAFLSWVAYASVNVVFKEQIISAKERNLIAMQTNYEVRLSQAQQAYERLHSFLIQAEDRFQNETDALKIKQQHLEEMVALKNQQRSDLASLQQRLSVVAAKADPKQPESNRLLMQVTDLDPAPRMSRSTITQAHAEGIKILGTIAALAIPQESRRTAQAAPATTQFSQLDAKIAGMRAAQHSMVIRFEESVDHDVRKIESILALTPVNVNSLVARAEKEDEKSTGGPLISLEDLSQQLKREPGGEKFSRQMLRLSDRLERLTFLNQALARVPLIQPVYDGIPVSSGFGARLDPFTHRVAFHSGLDFPGPYNTPVHATAAGVITRAGRYSAYGRLVEIDNGFGFKTRYGHLNKILVKVGEKVKYRQEIGLMGSSGRSTGPHCHYEVWYDGKVLDPAKFIEAGRYVFEN
jgi:murein DD-endopeptidase MepM/ murein hydrolase activator NlpD